MDTELEQSNRTSSSLNAKSLSNKSGLSESGSALSSGRGSTRESSPYLQPLSSSTTSSSGIEPLCDGLDLQDAMEHQHHFNPFDSSTCSPTNPGLTSNPGNSGGASGVVGPDPHSEFCSLSPHDRGYNNNSQQLHSLVFRASPSTSLLMPCSNTHASNHTPSCSSFTGLSSNNSTHRGLTASTWRNISSSSTITLPSLPSPPATIAGPDNSSSSPTSSLLPAFSDQVDHAALESSTNSYYNPFHHPQFNRPATMSSPITTSSPPSSPPSVGDAKGGGGNTGDNLGGHGLVAEINRFADVSIADIRKAVAAITGHNVANALVQDDALLAQVTSALAQNNGASTDMPAYAYCFERANGQYTRLIPADMLPPLMDIPALQQGCVGMIPLTCPTGLAPNGRSSNLERVQIQPTASSALTIRGGLGGNRDAIQSRIDSIVATSPPPFEAPRKQKIYCDKWIHEGVCAFTQQGCKYKHEMPLDKDTQESLGLFQGLPMWWRKHQGEITSDIQSQQPTNDMMAISSAALTGGGTRSRAGTGASGGGRGGGFGGQNRLRQNTWRSAQGGLRTGGHGASQPPHQQQATSNQQGTGRAGGGGGYGGPQHQTVAQFSSPFGPIAPPSTAANSGRRGEMEAPYGNLRIETGGNNNRPIAGGIIHRNPWASLKTENSGAKSDDSEDRPGVKLN